MLIKPYPPEIEERMKTLYGSLNEKDRPDEGFPVSVRTAGQITSQSVVGSTK